MTQVFESLWLLAGLLLTLMVLSYAFGDNPLFRLAAYAFIGIAAGYVLVLVYYQVLLPRLLMPYVRGSPTQIAMTIIPISLALLLTVKKYPQLSRLGSLPLAYLLGIGASLAAGGALLGTLIPQIKAVWQLFSPEKLVEANGELNYLWLAGALIIFLGTLASIIYFQYTFSGTNKNARQSFWLRSTSAFGQIFIGLTLGAVYAGILLTALTALIDRLDFIREMLTGLF